MKRFLISIILILGLAGLGFSTTYYVDSVITDTHVASATPDFTTYNPVTFSTSTGTASVYKTEADLNVCTFSGGDFIYFRQGQTWDGEQFIVPSSGAAGVPITIGEFGTGALPIIKYLPSFPAWDTAGTWTDNTGNVWWAAWTAPANTKSRLFLSGTEYMFASSIANVTSTLRWFYDSSAHKLYVYATSNPASFYSSMKVPSLLAYDGPLHISKDYINVENVNLQGGGCAIDINGANYVDINAVTFGLYSFYGAEHRGTNTYVNIHDSTFESGLSNATFTTEVGGDGIRYYTGSTTYSKIYNNTISNHAHTGVNITGTVINTMAHNEIYHNDISCPNTNYGRAIELTGTTEDAVTLNLVYDNYCHDLHSSAICVNGNHNKYYYNIINGVAAASGYADKTYAGGIYLAYSTTKTGSDEEVYNNIVYNVAGYGLYFKADATHPIANNIFKNNTIMNWGLDLTHTYAAIGTDDGEAYVGATTFTYNCFYKSGVTTNVIRWKGTNYTVAAFEAASDGGWTANHNVGSNPLFVSAATGDFHLADGSPCRDAGTSVSLVLDYAGDTVPHGTVPDIGTYEMGLYHIGSSGDDYVSYAAFRAAHTEVAGDIISFRKGDTFREMLTLPTSGAAGNVITYTSHGTGALPRILGSDQLTTWDVYSGNVWSCAHTGTIYNIWFVNVSDGKTHYGNKKTSAGACVSEYDWYYVSNTVYCYAATDPDTRYTTVEGAARLNGIYGNSKNYITVQGLEVAYCQEIGIGAIWNITGWLIDGNTVHNIGTYDVDTAEGIFVRGSSTTAQNNICYECGDHGMYVNAWGGSTATNVIFQNNTLYNCHHSSMDCHNLGGTVDGIIFRYNNIYWNTDYIATDDSMGMYLEGSDASNYPTNVSIYYNIIYDVPGYGIRLAGFVRNTNVYNNTVFRQLSGNAIAGGSVGLYIDNQGQSNLRIVNNIVCNFDYCFFAGDSTDFALVDYNLWYHSAGGTKVYTRVNGNNYHYNDQAAYKAATGWDTHGLWEDPKFVGIIY